MSPTAKKTSLMLATGFILSGALLGLLLVVGEKGIFRRMKEEKGFGSAKPFSMGRGIKD